MVQSGLIPFQRAAFINNFSNKTNKYKNTGFHVVSTLHNRSLKVNSIKVISISTLYNLFLKVHGDFNVPFTILCRGYMKISM